MAVKKTIFDYEVEIKELHRKLLEYPDNITLLKIRDSKLDAWSLLIDVLVYVAQNEKKPWDSSEIGYPIAPMEKKADTGFDQSGDYVAHFSGGSVNCYCNTIIERKGGTQESKTKGTWGAQDLYGTFMNSKNRARFEREHIRMKKDARFRKGKMYILAECSYEDFLKFAPLFNGKKRNKNHIGASINSRIGTIAALYEMGIPVLFAGSRKRATELYNRIVRQNLKKNYDKYLHLASLELEIEDEEEEEEEDYDPEELELDVDDEDYNPEEMEEGTEGEI